MISCQTHKSNPRWIVPFSHHISDEVGARLPTLQKDLNLRWSKFMSHSVRVGKNGPGGLLWTTNCPRPVAHRKINMLAEWHETEGVHEALGGQRQGTRPQLDLRPLTQFDVSHAPTRPAPIRHPRTQTYVQCIEAYHKPPRKWLLKVSIKIFVLGYSWGYCLLHNRVWVLATSVVNSGATLEPIATIGHYPQPAPTRHL